MSGTGTFTTGEGDVSLNGNTTINGSKTFTTGTGAVSLMGHVTIDADKNLTMSGTGGITVGSGGITLENSQTIKNSTSGTVSINGDLEVGNGSGPGKITTTSGNLQIEPATNIVEIRGDGTTNGTVGQIKLNCSDNSHGQIIKAQPHSAAPTGYNTLLLPNGTGTSTLVSNDATQTLTNKTLTSPTIMSGTAVLTLPTTGGKIALLSDIPSSSSSSSGSSSISGISSKYRLVNPQTSSNAPNANWSAITGASDGSYLFATVNSSSTTVGDRNIWYSTDLGETWTKVVVGGGGLDWSGICCSSDGSILMAVAAETSQQQSNGHAWMSYTSGATWSVATFDNPQNNISTSRIYSDVCCNSDGNKFTAIVNGGYIYTNVGFYSQYSGDTTDGNGGNQKASQQKWYAIDCSSDGSKLAAVVGGSIVDAGKIWISTDNGDSWNEDTSVGSDKDWRDITMSADGTKLAAVVYGGNIWTSSDSGTTWTEDSSVGTTKNWVSITSSDDGTNLTAAETFNNGNDGNLWSSSDSGANWFEDYSVGAGKNWSAITSYGDDTNVVATIMGGTIYRFDRANYITVPETDQRVGIGTDQPTESLHVNRHMRLGNTTDAENKIFMVSSGQDWQVGTNANGFFVWDNTNNKYRFYIKGGDKIYMKGPIKGTTSTDLQFEDTIYANASISMTTHTFPSGTAYLGFNPPGAFESSSSFDNLRIGVKASGCVFWSTHSFGFLTTSDERIKDNITEVPDNLALQMLRDIDCNYYEYKDKISSRGTQKTIGFIAQQVKEHFPMAVSIQKDCIPNEMRILEATWNGLNMSSDLTDVSGVKYKFYVSNDPSGNDEVKKEIIGNADNTFTFDKHYNYIFCYGKEVDDLHTLAKQKLFTLNFSATQEIDKIQQEEKTKLVAAEERISALETENASLKAQLNSIEARLAALEA